MSADSTFTLLTESPEATEAAAAALAAALPGGCVVALYGTLGSGKTVFARGFARGLGIVEPVTSPTFSLVQEYRRPDGGWFFHLDLYRLDSAHAAIAFGVEEYLFRPGAVTLVEWAERIEPLLAGAAADATATLIPVHLDHAGENRRQLRFPARYAALLRPATPSRARN